MANTAYLMATTPGETYPSVRDGFNEETQILARSAGTVPLLWLAMFRPDDLVTDTIEVDEVIRRELSETEDDDDLVNALLTAMGGDGDALEGELIDDATEPDDDADADADAEVIADPRYAHPRLDEVLNLRGETQQCTAPVATVHTCRTQLERAVPVLSAVFGEDVSEYVAMMNDLLDGLDTGAVTIEVDELEDDRAAGEYQAELRMVLGRLDDAGDIEETGAMLRDITGLDARPWPPARLLADDLRDVPRDDFRNHARLLGESWERPVPWERADEH